METVTCLLKRDLLATLPDTVSTTSLTARTYAPSLFIHGMQTCMYVCTVELLQVHCGISVQGTCSTWTTTYTTGGPPQGRAPLTTRTALPAQRSPTPRHLVSSNWTTKSDELVRAAAPQASAGPSRVESTRRSWCGAPSKCPPRSISQQSSVRAGGSRGRRQSRHGSQTAHAKRLHFTRSQAR